MTGINLQKRLARVRQLRTRRRACAAPSPGLMMLLGKMETMSKQELNQLADAVHREKPVMARGGHPANFPNLTIGRR